MPTATNQKAKGRLHSDQSGASSIYTIPTGLDQEASAPSVPPKFPPSPTLGGGHPGLQAI
jgi:hypothetical protein